MSGGLVALFLTFGVGYVGSTAYLIYRDGIVDATMARHAEMEYAYQDRISLLRAEIDRVTSRHLVDTQSIENQVAALLDRQTLIQRRQGLLDELLARARAEGIEVARAAMPRPVPRPARGAEAAGDIVTGSIGVATGGPATDGPAAAGTGTAATGGDTEAFRPLLKEVQSALDDAEANQVAALDVLRIAAENETRRLARAVTRLGMTPPAAPDLNPGGGSASGGPFVPPNGEAFIEKAIVVDESLAHIRSIRATTAMLPIRAPIPGAELTSGFGRRIDPFLKRPALHSGVDFKADAGTPVRATAPGRVVFAGRNGGYGRMVEIEHAHGVTTRYAHLSRISVKRGARIGAGAIVGRVGSTGRSTGPHLHYETRRAGDAVDPTIYLDASEVLW